MPLLCCDVGLVSELRLTDGCVLMDLASPAVSGTSVYANGLNPDTSLFQLQFCNRINVLANRCGHLHPLCTQHFTKTLADNVCLPFISRSCDSEYLQVATLFPSTASYALSSTSYPHDTNHNTNRGFAV